MRMRSASMTVLRVGGPHIARLSTAPLMRACGQPWGASVRIKTHLPFLLAFSAAS